MSNLKRDQVLCEMGIFQRLEENMVDWFEYPGRNSGTTRHPVPRKSPC